MAVATRCPNSPFICDFTFQEGEIWMVLLETKIPAFASDKAGAIKGSSAWDHHSLSLPPNIFGSFKKV